MPNIRTFIGQLSGAYRERVFFLLLIRMAWLFVAWVLALVVLDAAVALPDAVRAALDGLVLALLVVCAAWSAQSMAARSCVARSAAPWTMPSDSAAPLPRNCSNTVRQRSSANSTPSPKHA